MAKPLPDFARQYGNWLTSRLTQKDFEGVIEVSTPMLDPLNDGMRVYFEHAADGTLIHDGGLTLETLAMQGVDIDSTARRQELVESILKSSGLKLQDDRIQTLATEQNLPQRMHFLLSAMHRVSDLWLTIRPSGSSDFFERVCSFLDEKKALYSTNLVIPGRTVEHPIDIVMPLPGRKERLIKLIGTPNVNTAKVVSFSLIEIADARPEAERVILINDESQQDNVKSISQQTESILRGYSSSMYRWSERNTPDFESLWKVA